MHAMFAEALGGWIFNFLLVCGSIAGLLLALVSFVPAARGNRMLTGILGAPALMVGLLITALWGYEYREEQLQDPTIKLSEYIWPWILFGALPIAVSLFTMLVAWLCNWEKKQ